MCTDLCCRTFHQFSIVLYATTLFTHSLKKVAICHPQRPVHSSICCKELSIQACVYQETTLKTKIQLFYCWYIFENQPLVLQNNRQFLVATQSFSFGISSCGGFKSKTPLGRKKVLLKKKIQFAAEKITKSFVPSVPSIWRVWEGTSIIHTTCQLNTHCHT